MVDVSDDRFDLDMHDYEYNATITSSLYIDDSRVDTYDYTLAAFDGLSCVGYTDGLSLVDVLDRKSCANLTVVSGLPIGVHTLAEGPDAVMRVERG